ncbi:MAG: hypothetical protein ABSE97_04300 [Verrucomicrobiota bacterium]|jgi:hypothetical protein
MAAACVAGKFHLPFESRLHKGIAVIIGSILAGEQIVDAVQMQTV